MRIEIEKRKFALLAAFAVQVFLVIALNVYYMDSITTSTNNMGQILISTGMPLEQAETINSSIGVLKTNMSAYVKVNTFAVLLINFVMFLWAFSWIFKEEKKD